MKILWLKWLTLTGLLLTQTISTSAAASAEHSHAGRSHTHPLPAQGFAHRHGNGAPGIIVNRSGTITGTLTPNARNTTQPGSITGTFNSGGAVRTPYQGTGTINSGDTVRIPMPQTGQPRPTKTQPIPRLHATRYDKADTRCRRNGVDCNVCAVNVAQQFSRAAAGQINWHKDSWRFNWNQHYPPEEIRPIELFAGQKKYLLGIPDKHVQGFVRTNSNHYLFAGTHSHRNKGGIFLIRQNPEGDKYMAALFQTNTRHPSGVHSIGKYLAYGEQGNLYLKDLEEPSARDMKLPLPGPKANFGGGIGLTRLWDGSHLMVTTGPGGQDQRPRSNRFYHLRNHNGKPQRLHFIGETPQQTPEEWPAGFGFAENLSLISECGSGDIYAVHTSGDQEGVSAVSGNGYWRLSKLLQDGRQLRLQPVNAFVNRQSMSRCSMRATATVHVNPKNQLEFYCHGYAKNPQGSTLNVLGKSKNQFGFTTGRLQ